MEFAHPATSPLVRPANRSKENSPDKSEISYGSRAARISLLAGKRLRQPVII